LLWAVLPPLAVGFLEKMAFNTTYFFAFVQDRLRSETAAMPMAGTFPTHPMTHLTPGVFLSGPGLWGGLVVTALFLAAAARLRRYRGPI
jgi:ABC-2 type transport system permease protein